MEKKSIERSILSKIMSEIGKESHRRSPRPKEFYQDMANKRWGKHTCSKQGNMVEIEEKIIK